MVDPLIRIFLQVMKKLKGRILLEVARIDPPLAADPLILGDSTGHVQKMFTEKICSPVVGLIACQ